MTLVHFDKLKNYIEEISIKYQQLKYKNIQLEKENQKLKQQLDNSDVNPQIKNYNEKQKTEVEQLKEKNEEVKKHLLSLIKQLENRVAKHSGVDT
ncbi:MAG: hypothetical protein GF313_01915 [Caldithrix sp.]|nr:hypothetical protein [Caldithrix sp.]